MAVPRYHKAMKKFPSTARYNSSFVSTLKKTIALKDKLKKNLHPLQLDFGSVNILLPRSFGFCYGVENAIEITNTALDEHPHKRIFLLGELIHNQYVNDYFLGRGVQFLMTSTYEPLFNINELTSDDIVIVPAFGAPICIEEELKSRNINVSTYASTCPFVEKVWARAAELIKRQYTIVIHGSPSHEETESTKSRVAGKTPFIIIRNPTQAQDLLPFIQQQGTQQEFDAIFKQQASEGFDITTDLAHIGVINQTTMIAKETHQIMDMIKQTMIAHFGLNENTIDRHFAKTRDTLCYATNDNQNALQFILDNYVIDLAIAVGGYNSSNTAHLVELCEGKTEVYLVSSEDEIKPNHTLFHFNIHTKKHEQKEQFLQPLIQKIAQGEKPAILFLGGASCPDILIEKAITKIVGMLPQVHFPEEVITAMSAGK